MFDVLGRGGTLPMRIVVQGPSGSGKSTLALSLARSLDVPCLELDSVYHQSGWTPIDLDLFRSRVTEFAGEDGWVIDGNYSAVRDLLWARAELIVFLNLARPVVVARVAGRTLRRVRRHEELWNGNRETLRNVLSLNPERNLILWSWRTHARYQDQVPREARERAPHAAVVQLRSRRHVRAFLASFAL